MIKIRLDLYFFPYFINNYPNLLILKFLLNKPYFKNTITIFFKKKYYKNQIDLFWVFN